MTSFGTVATPPSCRAAASTRARRTRCRPFTIVALGHTYLEKGGNPAQVPVVHVWRFEGGTPKRIQVLTDTLQSAKLVGAV